MALARVGAAADVRKAVAKQVVQLYRSICRDVPAVRVSYIIDESSSLIRKMVLLQFRKNAHVTGASGATGRCWNSLHGNSLLPEPLSSLLCPLLPSVFCFARITLRLLPATDPRIVSMMIAKAQMEMEETRNQLVVLSYSLHSM